MIQAVIGQKKDQSQRFLENGTRIPVTEVYTPGNPVVFVRSQNKDNYWSIQLGFGMAKHPSKALLGHVKKEAKLKTPPRFLREVQANGENLPKPGDVVKAADVLKPGDIVDVEGVSKGKGYAGVVKRHHFRGGPRTHGQSDRERAPGSIGQTTTPGRVYRGKRMAGHMGARRKTAKNLQVVEVSENTILLKGLVPGGRNTILVVKKRGENKKFLPLHKREEKKGDSD